MLNIYASEYASDYNMHPYLDAHMDALRASGYTMLFDAAASDQRERVYEMLPPPGTTLPRLRLVLASTFKWLYEPRPSRPTPVLPTGDFA